MSQSNFFVSVIIPVYNGAGFLAQTITHVLQQNYHPLEIIIVDDGSTDETAEIAAQFSDKIRYFYQENKGPASARNLGIKQAQGNIIAFLDVDDLWSENKLKFQLNYLVNHPEVDIVQGMIIKQVIRPNNSSNESIEIIEASSAYHYILLGSCLYRKSVFTDVGLFNETMRQSDDVDWFVRAWEQKIKKAVVDEVTLFYRQHDSNMTKNKNLVESGFVRVYKKHLDRMRQSRGFIKSQTQDFPSMAEYLGREPKIFLNSTDYTIIANDCWAGFAYQKFGHMYQTPFVGTFVVDCCYLKLLKNLRYYLESSLNFTDHSKYQKLNNKRNRNYPIGLLDNDIEIHFLHENNQTEAAANWERRLKRINWNNLFIKFSDPHPYFDSNHYQYLEEFEKLKYSYKVCFTARKYPHLSSMVFIPNLDENGRQAFDMSQEYFDVAAWLDKKQGNHISNYLRNTRNN